VIAYERKKDEEERQRQLQSDALRNQLLKLQIQHANDPSEWKPTTKQEYLDTHPIKVETPRNTDPLSSEGIAATLRVKRGEAAISHAYPKPPSRGYAGEGDRAGARCLEFGSPEPGSDWEVRRRLPGDPLEEPRHGPGTGGESGHAAVKTSNPELFRKASDDPYGDEGSAPVPQPHTSHSRSRPSHQQHQRQARP
jgi:hypothetical protein